MTPHRLEHVQRPHRVHFEVIEGPGRSKVMAGLGGSVHGKPGLERGDQGVDSDSVADIELVVLGGGLGANGDLLLAPVRTLLAAWLPYPPRVEVSSLGEAAVLTGALAVGRQAALDNVFANRARPAPVR